MYLYSISIPFTRASNLGISILSFCVGGVCAEIEPLKAVEKAKLRIRTQKRTLTRIFMGLLIKMLLKSEDLILHCKKYLGDFKTPSKIHFLDELPKGPSGKIQRFKIKDLI